MNAFLTFWFVTLRIFTKYATCSTTSAIFLCYFFLFGVFLKGTQIWFVCNSSLKYFKLSLTQSYLIGVTVKTWNEYQITSIKYQVSMNQWISSNKCQITSIKTWILAEACPAKILSQITKSINIIQSFILVIRNINLFIKRPWFPSKTGNLSLGSFFFKIIFVFSKKFFQNI